MCAGSHLANRELFTAFLRIISAFTIVPAKDRADDPVLDPIDCTDNKTSLTLDPRPFKVGFRVRDRAKLDQWIRESDERTKVL